MEPDSSLPCPREANPGPYPVPVHTPTLFLLQHNNIFYYLVNV